MIDAGRPVQRMQYARLQVEPEGMNPGVVAVGKGGDEDQRVFRMRGLDGGGHQDSDRQQEPETRIEGRHGAFHRDHEGCYRARGCQISSAMGDWFSTRYCGRPFRSGIVVWAMSIPRL